MSAGVGGSLGTRMEFFLGLAAMSGEVPLKLCRRLPGGAGYRRRFVQAARERGLVVHYEKKRVHGYRLTAKGRALLLERRPERYAFFLTGLSDTAHLPYSVPRRQRLHRSSEVLLMMANAGVEIFRDKKPGLFRPNASSEKIKAPAYYTSVEIKEHGVDFQKVRNSRAVGALLLPRELYLIYNTGKNRLKWHENAEERLAVYLADYLYRLDVFQAPGEIKPKGILIGESMKHLEKFLTPSDRVKTVPLHGGVYWDLYWLPDTEEGEVLLKLICSPRKRESLRRTLLAQFSPSLSERTAMEMDARAEDGSPVLLACDCNVPRIHRFLVALQTNGETGKIVCFDFQFEFMEAFCGETADILTVDFEEFRKGFHL